MKMVNERYSGGRVTVWLIVICAAVMLPLFSQTAPAGRPAFELASIKPYAQPESGPRFFGFRPEPGGRIVMTGVTVRMLLTFAYRIRDFQVIGAPDWTNEDRYDIQAKAEDGSVPVQNGPRDPTVPDPLALRTQALLEDRFQMKLHREMKELPVYELMMAKGGFKLELAADQSPLLPPEPRQPGDAPPALPQRGAPPGRGGMFVQRTPAGFVLQATGVSLASFIDSLSQQVGRTVIDKSDLKPGLYDIKLQWSDNGPAALPFPPGTGSEPSAPIEPLGPSIFTALQEQLGLRLVSSKGPVEVFVIDAVQKPSLN